VPLLLHLCPIALVSSGKNILNGFNYSLFVVFFCPIIAYTAIITKVIKNNVFIVLSFLLILLSLSALDVLTIWGKMREAVTNFKAGMTKFKEIKNQSENDEMQ
jgi:hypothetical protein